MAKLTARQARFVEEYLVDLNATAAYRRAGYRASAKSANSASARLMALPAVQAAVAEAMATRTVRTRVAADDVVRALAAIAFGDLREAMRWGPDGVQVTPSAELPPEVAAGIAEVSQVETSRSSRVTVKWHNRLTALELLGKHLGIFAPVKVARTDSAGRDLEERSTDELRREFVQLLAVLDNGGDADARGGDAA